MLSAILTYSERGYIIDLGAIEAQNHVWIDFFGLVLEIAENVIQAAIWVNLFANYNAFLLFW